MKRLPVYIILIVVVSLFTGCQSFVSNETGTSGSASFFPLTPGSTWTYAKYDSVDSERDTVRIRILKTDTTSGEFRSLWQLRYTGHADSITVVSTGDTVSFDFPKELPVGFSGKQSIVLPLIVGKKWTLPIKISTQPTVSRYSVVSKVSISWRGGSLNNSYQVIQQAGITLENNGIHATTSDTTTYWIKPGIGIVKMHQFVHMGSVTSAADYFSDATWTLLSYKID